MDKVLLRNVLLKMEEIDDEVSMDASDATRSLDNVRSILRGTPFEQVLTDAITICDVITDVSAEKAGE